MSSVTFHLTPLGVQAAISARYIEANQSLIPTVSTLNEAKAGDTVALIAGEANDRNPLAWIAKYKGLNFYPGPPTCIVEGSNAISIRQVMLEELTERTVSSLVGYDSGEYVGGSLRTRTKTETATGKLPALDLPEEFRRTMDDKLIGLRSGYSSWRLNSGDSAFVGESAVNEALGKYGFSVEDYKKAVAHFGTRMNRTS